MQGTPTLQTIADIAKVSRSAVSLALRNNPALPLATRERIQQVATDIGYKPNPMVSALMSQLKSAKPAAEHGVIAFLTSHSTRNGWRHAQVFRDYFTGAADRAARLGYRVEEFWLKEPKMTAARMTKILETRGIAGIIVAPFPAGRGHLSLSVKNFASVALGYSMTRPKLHRVANHHIESIRLAMRELRHRGYLRIALMMHDVQDRRVNYNWSAGYLTFQQKLPAAEQLPICWSDGLDSQALLAWVGKHRPQAIMCGSPDDLVWLEEVNPKFSENIALVLVADFSSMDGKVAGVDQQGKLTGAAAVDMIVGQIHRNERGVPETPKVTLTESVWVDGLTVPKIGSRPSKKLRLKK